MCEGSFQANIQGCDDVCLARDAWHYLDELKTAALADRLFYIQDARSSHMGVAIIAQVSAGLAWQGGVQTGNRVALRPETKEGASKGALLFFSDIRDFDGGRTRART